MITLTLMALAASEEGARWIAPAAREYAGPEARWVWVGKPGGPEPTAKGANAVDVWLSRVFEAPAGATSERLAHVGINPARGTAS